MFEFSRLKLERIITNRPIEKLSRPSGIFEIVATPPWVECKPFPIFGEAKFNLNMKRALPPRSISRVRNCLVHGESAALFTFNGLKNAIHWAALPELNLGQAAANYSRFFGKTEGGWRFVGNPKLTASRRIERGVLIASRFSFNYFHFVCDSLVRALISDETLKETRNWPIVITQSPPQILRLLQLMFPGREVIVLEHPELVHFDELIVPVSSSFSPDDPAMTSKSVFDAPYLGILREALLIGMRPQSVLDRKRIIYVKRPFLQNNAGEIARTIINQQEVIEYLEGQGATVVSPEKMTVDEQRAIFSSADVVVAMAGSALANTIFCQPGTSVILICQNQIVSPEYFGTMSDELGLKYTVIACQPVEGSNTHPSHLSVTVKIPLLQESLDSALSEAKR